MRLSTEKTTFSWNFGETALRGRIDFIRTVRAAIDMAYQEKDSLEKRKTVALQAYREGLISLGKLSEILGVDTVSARLYLKHNKIPIRIQDAGDIAGDIRNA